MSDYCHLPSGTVLQPFERDPDTHNFGRRIWAKDNPSSWQRHLEIAAHDIGSLQNTSALILWLGVTTMWGAELKGHSIGKVESHCSRPIFRTKKTLALYNVLGVVRSFSTCDLVEHSLYEKNLEKPGAIQQELSSHTTDCAVTLSQRELQQG